MALKSWKRSGGILSLGRFLVVLISGSEDYLQEIQDRRHDLRPDGFLKKPIQVRELTQVLEPFSDYLEEA